MRILGFLPGFREEVPDANADSETPTDEGGPDEAPSLSRQITSKQNSLRRASVPSIQISEVSDKYFRRKSLDSLSNMILQADNNNNSNAHGIASGINTLQNINLNPNQHSLHHSSPSQASTINQASSPSSAIYLPDTLSASSSPNASPVLSRQPDGTVEHSASESVESAADGRDSYSSMISPVKRTSTSSTVATRATRPSAPRRTPSIFSRFFKSSGRPTPQDENTLRFGDRATEEGYNADVLWYVPNTSVQPKYIRVRAHKKESREFSKLFLAQELSLSGSTAKERFISRVSLVQDDESVLSNDTDEIDPLKSTGALPDTKGGGNWAMEFSRDGRYLAVAGEDCIIRVWEVLSHPADRAPHDEGEESNSDSNSEHHRRHRKLQGRRRKCQAYAPVFKDQVAREYLGHTSDVLALSWSKNNFLLSSSMDKTVRLWHVNRTNCLGCFQHSDFVTSIKFHPSDDRFFLSGSLDCRLRLWSIPDGDVAFSRNLSDLVTAVAFSPDGDKAIAGCFGGACLFFETDGLKPLNEIFVRSTRGRNSHGSKITGIEPIVLKKRRYSQGFDNNIKLLISTNDSRIRMYNLHDHHLDVKFKGHENEQSQIEACFSDDGRYVISGSEDERTYIWRVSEVEGTGKERQEYEYFHLNKAQVTCAKFAPAATRRLLANSRDPIYDICDPPPVVLTPTDEAVDAISTSVISPVKKMTARSNHEDGNIIVTADRKGVIKVFRQDCAYVNRKSNTNQKKRISTMNGLSPQASWRESRSRSVRSTSTRGLSPRVVSSEHIPTATSTPIKSRNTASVSPIGPRDTSHGKPPSLLSVSSSSQSNSRMAVGPVNGDDLLSCRNCNGLDFKAVKGPEGAMLVCSKCGREVRHFA